MPRAIFIASAAMVILCMPSRDPAMGQESMSLNYEKIKPQASKPGQQKLTGKPGQKKGGMLVPAVQKVRDAGGRSRSKTRTTPLLPKALTKND